MSRLARVLPRFLRRQHGNAVLAYGLIVGLVAVVAIVAINSIGSNVASLFLTVDTRLVEVAGGSTGGDDQDGGDEDPSGPDGPPDLGPGEVSVPTGSTFFDVSDQVRALFVDQDTPLAITFAGNGDDACVVAVRFDGDSGGSVEVSTAANLCSGSFQVQMRDSQGETTAFTTVPVSVTPADCAGFTGAEAPGTLCALSGQTVVFAGLTQASDQGDTDISGPLTPFFAARCDQGQAFNETSGQCECDAGSLIENASLRAWDTAGTCDDPTGAPIDLAYDRSNIRWDSGVTRNVETDLDDVLSCPGGGGTCTLDGSIDGTPETWNVAWDGRENSTFLSNVDSDDVAPGVQPHNAVEACLARGSGWYLPAINELNLIYTQRAAGAFAGTFRASEDGFEQVRYWSSSEKQSNDAWDTNLVTGANGRNSKEDSILVRCVTR